MILLEPLKAISNVIPSDNIFYNKSTKILSIKFSNYTFVGFYKKSTRISEILDDLYAALGDAHFERKKISILDVDSGKILPESSKLKDMKSSFRKKQVRIEEDGLKPQIKEESFKDVKKKKKKEKEVMEESVEETIEDEMLFRRAKQDVERTFRAEELKAPPKLADSASLPSAGAPGAPPKPANFSFKEIPSIDEPVIYNINMGLQYYSVMMEKRSYLFYVYFSHEELKIIDEEGKTIFKTAFTIETTKKEPPILDLKIEGEGFEVHPLSGKVSVKKDAINPPLMIFSVLPLKNKKRKRKDKKKNEKRFLNVYIEFENEIINHTILSIIVQPKHFHIDIGPFQIDISKTMAMVISFLSVLIATISFIYSTITFESQSLPDFVSGFAPGLGSILFFVIFMITLFKEGIYPLKQKWSDFLNFDKTSTLMK